MEKRQKSLRVASLIIYIAGIILGMTIAGGIVWSDLEASLFDSSIKAKSSLSLRCPVVITTHESGVVTAILKNPTEREKNFYIRAHISEGFVSLKREIDQQIPVAPGEKGEASWGIYPEDAAYNRIILFRAFVNASYPLPTQGNFCGVLVVDIPLVTGAQLFILILGIYLACLVGGMAIWKKANRPMNKNVQSITNAMIALGVIIFGTIAAGYFGQWILGVLLFAVSILLIGIIVGRYFSSI